VRGEINEKKESLQNGGKDIERAEKAKESSFYIISLY